MRYGQCARTALPATSATRGRPGWTAEKAEEVKREVRSAAARRHATLPMDVLEPIAAEPYKDAGLATGGLNRQSATTKCPPFRAEPTLDFSPGWTSTHRRSTTEPTSSNAHPD
ncbi:hypothetical protein V1508DRAFT_401196 [Lipomyces doorenjongii]|uniref:uncharacterized protein n=1 Tax=Lipomyces doorenjongii TaxID=383834 RepID=UPI0034CF52F2